MQRPSLGTRFGGSSWQKSKDPLLAIALSLVVASVCTVYPLPYQWVSWRPLLILLITLFWIIYQPRWCGIWFAFLMGLICDLMMDTQLGQQAFSFVTVVFVVRYIVQNRRVLTFNNAWLLASIGVFGYLVVMFVLQKLSGQMLSIHHWLAWLPTIMLWPVVMWSLKRWRI